MSAPVSWGIGEALREDQPERRVVLVGHEVTEATKLLLLEGTMDAAIDQNPRVEAREALNVLAAAVAGRTYGSSRRAYRWFSRKTFLTSSRVPVHSAFFATAPRTDRCHAARNAGSENVGPDAEGVSGPDRDKVF